MHLNIVDEVSSLRSVVVGIADDFEIPHINPKIQEHAAQGTLPAKETLIRQINTFAEFIQKQGVIVHRPKNIQGQYQIYTRDIAFVIGSTLVIGTMKEPARQQELRGIEYLIQKIRPKNVLYLPPKAVIEGGDVVLHNGMVFVGIGGRTSMKGYHALKDAFPERKIIPLQLASSSNPLEHTLHLDCTFQPVGKDCAILCPEGFAEPPQALYAFFPPEKIIKVSPETKYHMVPNVFSLGPDAVVSEPNFHSLNDELRKRKIAVHEIPYAEMSKLGGLFRCSTLPLLRE